MENIASIFGETIMRKKEIEKKKALEKEKLDRKKAIMEKVRLYENGCKESRIVEKEKENTDIKHNRTPET